MRLPVMLCLVVCEMCCGLRKRMSSTILFVVCTVGRCNLHTSWTTVIYILCTCFKCIHMSFWAVVTLLSEH